MSLHRRAVVAGLAALPLLARAQAPWPSRPIKIVVPFPAGGITDHITRLIGGELAKTLGQPLVVENKPGAGSVIGIDAVAKSAPDGYTFATVANAFTVNHTLVKKLPYHTVRDFEPVGMMGLSEHVLAAHPGTGLTKLADVRELARRKPLAYASFGTGTSAHLAGEMLRAQLKVDLTHVPYRGGPPALNDLLAGQVAMMFGNWPELRAHVASGKLVPLGMATAKRSVYAPQIPTLREQGLDLQSYSWSALMAPAGTPEAVVRRVNAEINKALALPAVVDAFQQGGIASMPGTPENLAEFIRVEIARYGDIIRTAGITLDS